MRVKVKQKFVDVNVTISMPDHFAFCPEMATNNVSSALTMSHNNFIPIIATQAIIFVAFS